MKLYILKEAKGVNAVGEYDPASRQLVVLKGSTVSNTISTAPTFRGANAIRELRKRYVIDRVVTENIRFWSSSTAGNFITGLSTDGPGTWKDKNGKTLRSILLETKE